MAETRPPTTELQVESTTQQPLHHRASTSTGPQALKKNELSLNIYVSYLHLFHLFLYVA